jgi:pimeloyl-ACP methyl ester carboxylesterase
VISTSASLDFIAPNIKTKFAKVYETSRAITEVFLPQPLDHFDSSNPNVWEQRVFMNDEHYRLGGPALFFFSGKLNPSDETYWLLNSLGNQIAEEYGGVLYAIEPRYFGDSRPTADLSNDNLKYLTINQTLADFEYVISILKIALQPLETTKMIAFGYGIGSTYATWLHQSYPGLLDGVLASSAQLEVIPNYYRYYPDISETLRKHAPEICFERITGGLAEAGDIIAAGDGNQIQELFNFYEPVDTTNERDVAVFYSTIGSILGQFLEWRNAAVIDEICSIIDAANHDSDVEDLAFFVRYVAGNEPIQGNFNVILDSYREESWDSVSAFYGVRQLVHLSCNQLVWFKSAPEIPMNIFTEVCSEIYEISEYEVIQRSLSTNYQFAIDSNLANVYFTHGDMDPFRWTGIRSDLNENSPSDIIPNVGKSFDLPRLSEYDSIETQAVKERAIRLVGQWIE